MTYDKIIISIGVLIGLSLFKKTNPIFLKATLIGLILSFGLSFFSEKLLINISFFSFGILTFIFAAYSGLNKKWMNLIIGFFAFMSFLWSFMNWLLIGELRFLMLIPIICFAVILRKLRDYKNELSILTILVTYELTQFFVQIEQWLN